MHHMVIKTCESFGALLSFLIFTKVVAMSTSSYRPFHQDSTGGNSRSPSETPPVEKTFTTGNLFAFRLSKLLHLKTSESGIPSLSMIAAFERAAREGDPPLGDYLSGEGRDRLRQLVELTHSALELGIRAGRSKRLADYLREYPELASSRMILLL